MDKHKVEFFYNGERNIIYCSEKELMKDIIEKFCIKVKVEKSTIYCLHSGKILDENITLEKWIKLKTNEEKIIILVYPRYFEKERKNEPIIKSSYIICPECKNLAKIKNIDYKITINCRDNHNINNIFLKDLNKTQLIDESKIICNICG